MPIIILKHVYSKFNNNNDDENDHDNKDKQRRGKLNSISNKRNCSQNIRVESVFVNATVKKKKEQKREHRWVQILGFLTMSDKS
jgi:hypothetical protein